MYCRTDGGHNNLRTAAYEALMSLIKHSAKDCYMVIRDTTQVILTRLQQAVQLDVSQYLCNCVTACVTAFVIACVPGCVCYYLCNYVHY